MGAVESFWPHDSSTNNSVLTTLTALVFRKEEAGWQSMVRCIQPSQRGSMEHDGNICGDFTLVVRRTSLEEGTSKLRPEEMWGPVDGEGGIHFKQKEVGLVCKATVVKGRVGLGEASSMEGHV